MRDARNASQHVDGVLTKMIGVEVGMRGPASYFYSGVLRTSSLLQVVAPSRAFNAGSREFGRAHLMASRPVPSAASLGWS